MNLTKQSLSTHQTEQTCTPLTVLSKEIYMHPQIEIYSIEQIVQGGGSLPFESSEGGPLQSS